MVSSGNSMSREITGARSQTGRHKLKDNKVKTFKEKRYKENNISFKFV